MSTNSSILINIQCIYKEQLLACFFKFRLLRLGRQSPVAQWPLGESLPMFEERAAYLALAITAALGPTACHQMQSPATQTHIVSCSCHNHHHHHRKKDTPTPSTTHVQVPSFAFFVHRVYSFPVAGDAGQQGDEMKKLKLKVERQDPPSSPNYLPSSMEWYVILQDLKTLQHQCIFWKVVCSMCKVLHVVVPTQFLQQQWKHHDQHTLFSKDTPPKTNSSHLKMDPWKMRFLLETMHFQVLC